MSQTNVTQIKAKYGFKDGLYHVVSRSPDETGWRIVRTVPKRITAAQIAKEIEAGRHPLPPAPILYSPKEAEELAEKHKRTNPAVLGRGRIMRLFQTGKFKTGIASTSEIVKALKDPSRTSTIVSTYLSTCVRLGLLERHAINYTHGSYEYGLPGTFNKIPNIQDAIIRVLAEHPSGLTKNYIIYKLDCAIPYKIMSVLRIMVDKGTIKLKPTKPKVTQVYYT